MKKVISILVALGLVLGLSVMAAPVATADCPVPSVTNCAVSISPDVECETACYNITFNVTNALALGEWISVKFPTCAGITGANATVGGTPATVNPATTGEIHIVVPGPISAGTSVSVFVCNVTNCAAGDYSLEVKTIWDQCPCIIPFTIKAGGSISPAAAIWCINSCNNVTTTITWGASTSILNVTVCNGTALPGWAIAADNATLHITCADLMTLGLTPCQVITACIDFNPGCNVTMTITAAAVHNITIKPGWNLISLPLIPLDPDITKVLAGIDSSVASVWYWDGCDAKWYVYKNGTGFDSLTTMEECNAYWICSNATGNVTLQVCGFKLPCPPGVPPCCCYCPCWNMVSFHRTTSMNMSDYTQFLSPAGTLIGVVTYNCSSQWETIYPSSMMNPGQGYWMAFTANACIVPPL